MSSGPHDIYGFVLSYKGPHQAAEYQRAQALYAAQEKAWEKYAAERHLPRRGKLKNLIRRGVPPKLRPWVWFEVSGAKQLKESQAGTSYYANLLKATSMSKAASQVELVSRREAERAGSLGSCRGATPVEATSGLTHMGRQHRPACRV
jgi:hypothetical protein